jgi:uncharacterized protein
MNILLALLLGGLFGFVLERVGASDPDKILGMLRLKDLHLMKAIFTGIGLSSALLFALLLVGGISTAHLSIKGMYSGVILGGVLLGFGWALGGFCPGTAVVAAGRGRKDALVFILGGLIGAGLYTLLYSGITDAGWLEPLWGGRVTLAETGAAKSTSLLSGAGSRILAILIALAMLAIGILLPLTPKKIQR